VVGPGSPWVSLAAQAAQLRWNERWRKRRRPGFHGRGHEARAGETETDDLSGSSPTRYLSRTGSDGTGTEDLTTTSDVTILSRRPGSLDLLSGDAAAAGKRFELHEKWAGARPAGCTRCATTRWTAPWRSNSCATPGVAKRHFLHEAR